MAEPPPCYRCGKQPCECKDGISLYCGDCLEVMPAMEPDSVHAIMTDPPYGLGFMGKGWDHGVPGVPFWSAALRVAKSGAHLLAFGGTRTFHRLACALEDAGWEIRDCLMWIYGSGFPKSLDVSKAIDKARRRDYVQAAVDLGMSLPGRSLDDWTKESHAPGDRWWAEFRAALPAESWAAIERRVIGTAITGQSGWFVTGQGDVTAPATDAAAQWSGWGTALKPAWEPIILARKPLDGTVAANVQAHGCGALNIDGCRISTGGEIIVTTGMPKQDFGGQNPRPWHENPPPAIPNPRTGRWPANLILSHHPECVYRKKKQVKGSKAPTPSGKRSSQFAMGNGYKPIGYADADGLETVEAWDCHPDCPIGMFPVSTQPSARPNSVGKFYDEKRMIYSSNLPRPHNSLHGDSGTAARFFYCAKADRAERGKGNTHPTVKPIDLMAYLCKLVSQPGHKGTLLDPFAGSGSTLLAASRWFDRCIGIELEEASCAIAANRLKQEVLF